MLTAYSSPDERSNRLQVCVVSTQVRVSTVIEGFQGNSVTWVGGANVFAQANLFALTSYIWC